MTTIYAEVILRAAIEVDDQYLAARQERVDTVLHHIAREADALGLPWTQRLIQMSTVHVERRGCAQCTHSDHGRCTGWMARDPGGSRYDTIPCECQHWSHQ